MKYISLLLGLLSKETFCGNGALSRGSVLVTCQGRISSGAEASEGELVMTLYIGANQDGRGGGGPPGLRVARSHVKWCP